MKDAPYIPNGTGSTNEQTANASEIGEKDREDILDAIAEESDMDRDEVASGFSDVSMSTLKALAVELGPGGGEDPQTTANADYDFDVTSGHLGKDESDLEANSGTANVASPVVDDTGSMEIDLGFDDDGDDDLTPETRESIAKDIVANSAEYDTVEETLEDFPNKKSLRTKRQVLTSSGSPVPTVANADDKVEIGGGSEPEFEVTSGVLGGGE
jgi:hypothetical protein